MEISEDQNEIKDSNKIFKFMESKTFVACTECVFPFLSKDCKDAPCNRNEREDKKNGYFQEVVSE